MNTFGVDHCVEEFGAEELGGLPVSIGFMHSYVLAGNHIME